MSDDNILETGLCPQCGVHHHVNRTGRFKKLGMLCSAGLLVTRVHPGVAIGAMIASYLFGDAVEHHLNDRCPDCHAVLRTDAAGALARTR